MSESPKQIARDELHERVWTTPFVRLAKELGYSYLDLVAICAELLIPRPTGGYWYRLAHGGGSERSPLPPAAPDTRTVIPFGPRLSANPAPERPGPESVDVNKAELPPIAITPSPVRSSTSQLERGQTVSKSVVLEEDGPVAVRPPVREARPAPVFPDVVVLNRKQLYDHLWATPCQLLAKALGVSDVALAKTCRQMEVPRPPRGYWARVEAGERMEKTPLPPDTAAQVRGWKFNVAANHARREQWTVGNIITAGKGNKPVRLELAVEGEQLHPIAERHQQALEKAKPDEKGLVRVGRRDLFLCEASAALVPRLVAALHAITCEFDRRGYKFAKSDSEYRGLEVLNGPDRVSLEWREASEQIEREPTIEEKRKPSWTWQLKEWKPTGHLGIEVRAMGLRGTRKWTEKEGRPIEEVLGRVVEKVAATFCGFEDQRQREVERAKQREEEAKRLAEQRAREAEVRAREEVLRKDRERIERHEAKLEEVAAARRKNLNAAAERWQAAERIEVFIAACEKHWRDAGRRGLTKEQKDWLAWARAEAVNSTPLAKGYPDPALDGSFEAGAVPVGGPYPEVRALVQEMRKAPEPKPAGEAQVPPTQMHPWSPYPGWR